MKRRRMAVLVLGAVFLVAALAQKSLAQAEPGASTQKASVIEFQRQSLVFAPTRIPREARTRAMKDHCDRLVPQACRTGMDAIVSPA